MFMELSLNILDTILRIATSIIAIVPATATAATTMSTMKNYFHECNLIIISNIRQTFHQFYIKPET
jgi:hypothetical protein